MELCVGSQKPLVSVMMTCYNRERYIATAIESVLAQTLKNFELIIVDDGSTDSSVEIARRYEHDSRVKVHRNKKNLGDYPNRNRAASLAQGKYLKYVDSDDAIYPHCLEVMVHMMEMYPEVGILLCNWFPGLPIYPVVMTPQEAYHFCFVDDGKMSNSPLTTMYRRDLFEKAGGFDTRWRLSCDWEMVLKMARHYSVLIAPTGLCFYRVHDGQIVSTTQDSYRSHLSEGLAIAIAALRNVNCPLENSYKRQALNKLRILGFRYAASLVVKRQKPLRASAFLKNIGLSPFDMFPLLGKKGSKKSKINRSEIPDWNDYPRSVTLGSVTSRPLSVKISVIFSDLVYSESLRIGIESILIQGIQELELLLAHTVCLNQALSWVNDPRIVFFDIEDGCTDWDIYNAGARVANGEFIKFIGAGTFLYPYALEFEYAAIKGKDNNKLLVSGNVGFSALHPLSFSPIESISLEASGTGRLLRSDTSCCLIFRETFIVHGCFNVHWQEWASFVLFAEVAVQSGVTQGFWALSSRWDPAATLLNDLPHAVHEYLEELCQQYFGKTVEHRWLPHLAEQWTSSKMKLQDSTDQNWNSVCINSRMMESL